MVYTPFVYFRYDLFDNLAVRICVRFDITVVTVISYMILSADRLRTVPFYVNIHPPSK